MQDEACKQDEVRRSTVSSRSPTCNLRNLNMELSCGNTKPFTFSQQTKLLFSLPRTPPKAFECSLCPPILNPRPLLRVVVVCFGVVLPVFHGLPLSVSGVCVCVSVQDICSAPAPRLQCLPALVTLSQSSCASQAGSFETKLVHRTLNSRCMKEPL